MDNTLNYFFINPEGHRIDVIPLCICSPGNTFIHLQDKNNNVKEYIIAKNLLQYEKQNQPPQINSNPS